MKKAGYRFHLFYVWVPSAEVSIQRVRERVIQGGHGIPADTIRRRYKRTQNFLRLYRPLADNWEFYDNTALKEPRLVAIGNGTMELADDEMFWAKIKAQVNA